MYWYVAIGEIYRIKIVYQRTFLNHQLQIYIHSYIHSLQNRANLCQFHKLGDVQNQILRNGKFTGRMYSKV